MVPGAVNGFGQIEFAPQGKSCTVRPCDIHPMYSTSTPQTRIMWAAHSTNVTFADELGHFDFCTQVATATGSRNGLEGGPGDHEPEDADDDFCHGARCYSLNA